MSHGAPTMQIKQHPNLRAVIISASWHPEICDALVAGAKRGLAAAGIRSNSFELTLSKSFGKRKQELMRTLFD